MAVVIYGQEMHSQLVGASTDLQKEDISFLRSAAAESCKDRSKETEIALKPLKT